MGDVGMCHVATTQTADRCETIGSGRRSTLLDLLQITRHAQKGPKKVIVSARFRKETKDNQNSRVFSGVTRIVLVRCILGLFEICDSEY